MQFRIGQDPEGFLTKIQVIGTDQRRLGTTMFGDRHPQPRNPDAEANLSSISRNHTHNGAASGI